MESFVNNSHAAKALPSKPRPAEKKVEKIVTGRVTTRKKPLMKRLKEAFIGDESGSIGEYLLFQVLIPAAKDTIVDMGVQAVERTFYGEARSASRRGYPPLGANRSSFNYNRVTEQRKDDQQRQMSRRARASHDFDEIVLSSRMEAEAVLDQMYELLSTYNQVTISDLYDLLDIAENYTDEKYGWTDLTGAGVTTLRGGGYLLNLPRPEVLR